MPKFDPSWSWLVQAATKPPEASPATAGAN
jgi:hypothetical protein